VGYFKKRKKRVTWHACAWQLPASQRAREDRRGPRDRRGHADKYSLLVGEGEHMIQC
jgi:hypothetical protein